MTIPTRIKHGTADWWVLQTLRDFGAMTAAELCNLGTHETPEALKRTRYMHMVGVNHDKMMELQPKGRNALISANQERARPGKQLPAMPRTTVNSTQREIYTGRELQPFDGRPGAMDAFDLPSVMLDRRTWRDGRVEVFA
jgi:hypothetical protein